MQRSRSLAGIKEPHGPVAVLALRVLSLAGESEEEYDPAEDAMAQEVPTNSKPVNQSEQGERTQEPGVPSRDRPTPWQSLRDRNARPVCTHDDDGSALVRGQASVGVLDTRESRIAREGGPEDRRRSPDKVVKRFEHRGFVTGEHGGTSWKDRKLLEQHFSQFGRVLDVFTPLNGKAVAYVAFETSDQLQNALSSSHVVSGCTLRLKRAETRPPIKGLLESQSSSAGGWNRDRDWEGRERPRDSRDSGRDFPRDREGVRELHLTGRLSPPPRRLQRDSDQQRQREVDRHAERDRNRDREQYFFSSREADRGNYRGSMPDRAPETPSGALKHCGVGMTLEPADPGRDGYCVVHSIEDGGAVHNSGGVMVGDQLVRVDDFNCKGALREDIKPRVLGPPGSEVSLEFMRGGVPIQVTVRRSVPAFTTGATKHRGNDSSTKRAGSTDDSAMKATYLDIKDVAEKVGQPRVRSDVHDEELVSISKRAKYASNENIQSEHSDVASEVAALAAMAEGLIATAGVVDTIQGAGEVGQDRSRENDSSRLDRNANEMRETKRSRTDSPHDSARNVPRTRSEGAVKIDDIISQAGTRKALVTDLLAAELDVKDGARGIIGSMSACQVVKTMQSLLSFRKDDKEGMQVTEDEAQLVKSLSEGLAMKCDELPSRCLELQNAEFLLHSVDVAAGLGCLHSISSDEESRQGCQSVLMKSLVKVANRIAFILPADDVVQLFSSFACSGKEAGKLLLHPKDSYAILKRAQNVLGSMKPDALMKIVDSLYVLDSDLPQKFQETLLTEIKRMLRDNRFMLAAESRLLSVVARMIRNRDRDDVMSSLADKMRGLLADMTSQMITVNMMLLANCDVLVNAVMLQEVANEAEKRAKNASLLPRQAVDILWALYLLDWKEDRDGVVAVTLADAALVDLQSANETTQSPVAWSPWSPSAEDDAISGNVPNDAGQRTHGPDDTRSSQQTFGQDDSSDSKVPVCHSKNSEYTVEAVIHGVKGTGITETQGCLELGSVYAARLLWTLTKLRMLEKARDVMRVVEHTLWQEYHLLGHREVADVCYTVTEGVALNPVLQKRLCQAAILCAHLLTAGELAVTLQGLMSTADSAVPSELLDKILERVRLVRRGLSVRNCVEILRCLLKNPKAPDAHDESMELEKSLVWQRNRNIARELCLELSGLAEKLDSVNMALIMRAVAVFGLKFSVDEGRNLCRRALALHGVVGGGDRRGKGRGENKMGGFDDKALIWVIGGLIASGICLEDMNKDHVSMHVNVVEVLCEELRGRVNNLPGDLLAEAFVAVAVGGAAPVWNALDVIDIVGTTKMELPISRQGSKAASCRKGLLTVLLGAHSTWTQRAEDAQPLADMVCACALSKETCGAEELMQDQRVVLMLQDSGKRVASIGPRTCCALVSVLALRGMLPCRPAFGEFVANLAANKSKLSSRELALALHAIARLNQENVAPDFRSLASEAVARLNSKPLSDWGLRAPASQTQMVHVNRVQTPEEVSGTNALSGIVGILELLKYEDAESARLKQTLSSVSMVLWAQAVMSQYLPANTDFFLKAGRRKVTWDIEVSEAARAEGADNSVQNSMSEQPLGLQGSSVKDGGQQGSLYFPESELFAKLCRVWKIWDQDSKDPNAQACPSINTKAGAMGELVSQQMKARLHEVALCLQLASNKNIHEEIVAVGGGKDQDIQIQHLRQECKRAFDIQQQKEGVRCIECATEICQAASDLGLVLQCGLVDETSGIATAAGNAQQRVAIDVLLERDVVSEEDAGTLVLLGGRALRRRLLELSKWSVVHLKEDSWTLLRENNLEKKRWLFASDRLRVFAGTPNWDEEYAVANALEAVDGSLALAAFLEIVVCTHPQKLKVLDAAMVTSCFRKMALSLYPSPRPKQVPGQVGHLAAGLTLDNAEVGVKRRIEDLLANSGLQARALEHVEYMSFMDAAGVLVSIAQVWSALGSPRSVLLPALVAALCDRISKELVPSELTSSLAERLAVALSRLAVPPMGESELSSAALKAGVSVVLSRCRDVSVPAASSAGGFLASLDPSEATALVSAAALLVPVSTRKASSTSQVHSTVREGGLFAVEDVWCAAAEGWHKQPIGPDESVVSQVTALSTRLSSLVAGRSLSAAQLMQLVGAFGRGTARDISLFRSILARLSEFYASDSIEDGPSAESGSGLGVRDLLQIVWTCVRHGLQIDALPQPMIERLQHPHTLAELTYDEVLYLIWSMAWGIFWDMNLWSVLLTGLQRMREMRVVPGKGPSPESEDDKLLDAERDAMLLWAVAAAGRLHARTLRVELEPSALGRGGWTVQEGALCREALISIAKSWDANAFEVRTSSISFSSRPQLPDAHTDMLRQAFCSLRFLEQDGSIAKAPRRNKGGASGKGSADKERLLKFVDEASHHLQSSLLALEQSVTQRGAHMDKMGTVPSSHVRQDVAIVLSMLGHRVSVEEETGFKAAAAGSATAVGTDTNAKGGWLWLHGAVAVVRIYSKMDFMDCLQLAECHSSCHLGLTSAFTRDFDVSSSAATAQAAASLGLAPRVLHARGKIWERLVRLQFGASVIPLSVDIWQECLEEAAQEAMECSDSSVPQPPTRRSFLAQLVQEVSADSSLARAADSPRVRFALGEGGGRMGSGKEAEPNVDDEQIVGEMSPGSISDDSPTGGHSPMDLVGSHGVNGDVEMAGDEKRAVGRRQSRKDKKRDKVKEIDKAKKLWKIEFSKSKQRWYYFNSKTRERLWKPPNVEGWVVKTGSGKHRPYVGLRTYYYNPATKKAAYEPPVNRDA